MSPKTKFYRMQVVREIAHSSLNNEPPLVIGVCDLNRKKSATQTELRNQMVTCCRILDGKGLTDAYGHVSVLLDDSGTILLTSRAAPGIITRSDILEIDTEGNVIKGSAPIPIEFHMHTQIYKRRRDVKAICRAHPFYTGILASDGIAIKVVYGFGAFLGSKIPQELGLPLVTSRERGEEIARKLGKASAIVLRGNGAITVGSSIKEALAKSIFLESAAKMYFKALLVGKPLIYSAREIEARMNQSNYDHYSRIWNYYEKKYAVS